MRQKQHLPNGIEMHWSVVSDSDVNLKNLNICMYSNVGFAAFIMFGEIHQERIDQMQEKAKQSEQ